MTDLAVTLLEDLLRNEGGYVDHPHDRGGATNFGITETVARSAGWAGTMRDLPRDFALAIYRRRYWTLPGLDRIAALAPKVAAELFDTGVNMGPAVAVAFLHRALNALNRGARDFPDLVPGGRIDDPTIAALTAYLKARAPHGEGYC